MGCTLTLPSALNIILLPWPFFLIEVNHQHLPFPGISENTTAPSGPDLLEEKLRSQLEEEKRRCPFFSPRPACPQPQRALRDSLEPPRTGRAVTPQARSFSGKWVPQLSPKAAGGGAAFEQADARQDPRQCEVRSGSRRPTQALEPRLTHRSGRAEAQEAESPVSCCHLGESSSMTTEGFLLPGSSTHLPPCLLSARCPENITPSGSHLESPNDFSVE